MTSSPSSRNAGLIADLLFVGLTRPPMRWGVTFTALLFNLLCVMEVFVLTKNLLVLGLALPIHGISALLCARDARFFELLVLYVRARTPAWLGNYRFWRAASVSALPTRFTRRARLQGPVLRMAA